MDHPQITRTLATGYPNPERNHNATSRKCTHCDEDMYDTALEYEDNRFCDKYCFADWAVKNGVVREVSAD